MTRPEIDPKSFAWSRADEYWWAVTYCGVHVDRVFMFIPPGSPTFDDVGVRQEMAELLEGMLKDMSNHEQMEFWLSVAKAGAGALRSG